LLYVQGTGDHWGSVSNVAEMADKSGQETEPVFVETHHRFGGYRHVIQHPEILTTFFEEHLP
jgi:hypothetical protein